MRPHLTWEEGALHGASCGAAWCDLPAVMAWAWGARPSRPGAVWTACEHHLELLAREARGDEALEERVAIQLYEYSCEKNRERGCGGGKDSR